MTEEEIRLRNIQMLPPHERFKEFMREFPNVDEEYSVRELFLWHFVLTKSCGNGRREFLQRNNLSMDEMVTVRKFLLLTQNGNYHDEVIKKLIEYYKAVNKW